MAVFPIGVIGYSFINHANHTSGICPHIERSLLLFQKHIESSVKYRYSASVRSYIVFLVLSLLDISKFSITHKICVTHSTIEEWECLFLARAHAHCQVFTARTSLNTAFHFRGTPAAVTQACALSHTGETLHPAWCCSLGEMDVESLMRRVLGTSWLWCHLCPTCGAMSPRSQLWVSCSACGVLKVCFKCLCLGSSNICHLVYASWWSSALLWPYQLVWEKV